MDRTVYTYGKDKRTEYSAAYLKRRLGDGGAVHILPIPTTKDGVEVYGGDITLDEISASAKEGEAYITYGVPERFAENIRCRGARIYDAKYDEEYQEEGAYLTALGTVVKILGNGNKSPRQLKIGIIGYGRIGRNLLEMLYFLGAELLVVTGRRSILESLSSLGVSAMERETLSSMRNTGENPFLNMDILINTAPAHTICSEDKENLKGVEIIELASGDNIPHDIPYTRFGSVPAEMFAQSAGISYAAHAIKAFGNSI